MASGLCKRNDQLLMIKIYRLVAEIMYTLCLCHLNLCSIVKAIGFCTLSKVCLPRRGCTSINKAFAKKGVGHDRIRTDASSQAPSHYDTHIFGGLSATCPSRSIGTNHAFPDIHILCCSDDGMKVTICLAPRNFDGTQALLTCIFPQR